MDPEDCQVMNSKPSDPQQRRPDGRMYFVENEVQSEGGDWQIANVVDSVPGKVTFRLVKSNCSLTLFKTMSPMD